MTVRGGDAVSVPQIDQRSVNPADFEKLKNKVKQALSENISPDETVRVIIRGAQGQAIVATDTRAFVCKPGFMAGATFGAEVASWSYQNITGVQVHKGMLTGSVVIQAPGQSGKKTSYWGQKNDDPYKAPNAIPVASDWSDVKAGVARLRQLIDVVHTPASSPAGQAAPSTADELRKLAELRSDGILSEEEFQTAKAQLLAR